MLGTSGIKLLLTIKLTQGLSYLAQNDSRVVDDVCILVIVVMKCKTPALDHKHAELVNGSCWEVY